MLASLLISLREGLEASLIVGIVFGYLKKTDQMRHQVYAWAGVIAAIVVSAVVAMVIISVGAELEGRAEEIFEGTMMFLAVAVLTWMIFWMRYQAKNLKSSIEGDLESMVKAGNPRGLFAVTFFAVVREGVETAIFLGAAALATDGASTLAGSILGLGIAALIGYLLYASTVRLDIAQFFNVTSVLLLLFAAGLFAHGIHEFQEAGIFPIINEHLWNISAFISAESELGQILKALFGYNPTPSLLEVVGYWSYWGFALFFVPRLVDFRIQQTNKLVTA